MPLCRAGEEMSQMQSSRHTVHVQTQNKVYSCRSLLSLQNTLLNILLSSRPLTTTELLQANTDSDSPNNVSLSSNLTPEHLRAHNRRHRPYNRAYRALNNRQWHLHASRARRLPTDLHPESQPRTRSRTQFSRSMGAKRVRLTPALGFSSHQSLTLDL